MMMENLKITSSWNTEEEVFVQKQKWTHMIWDDWWENDSKIHINPIVHTNSHNVIKSFQFQPATTSKQAPFYGPCTLDWLDIFLGRTSSFFLFLFCLLVPIKGQNECWKSSLLELEDPLPNGTSYTWETIDIRCIPIELGS